jgi:hypothetical protein
MFRGKSPYKDGTGGEIRSRDFSRIHRFQAHRGSDRDAVGVGAVGQLAADEAAGGMIPGMDGSEITLLTPASKLYQNLLGKRAADFPGESDLLVIEVS